MSKKSLLKKIGQDINYYLSLIDFFAAGVELTIKGNKKSPTVLGGVLTLFTLSILIIIFVIYIKNNFNYYLFLLQIIILNFKKNLINANKNNTKKNQ